MRNQILFRALLLCALPGACAEKSQDAVVVGKEFIAAVDPADLKPDEAVKDPRACGHDVWLVEIEMTNRVKADAPVEKAEWDALKVGDKVKATYSEGKYTRTIWSVNVKKT